MQSFRQNVDTAVSSLSIFAILEMENEYCWF